MATTQIGAFFDMDRTLLRCNTGTRWIQYLRRRGEISPWKALRALSWIARYKFSIIDMEQIATITVADMKGDEEAAIIAKTRRWLEDEILEEVAPRAREALAFHQREGHVTAILSMSTRYVTEPLAAHLGIQHVICTRLDIEEGRFVGTHVKPACYGEGKVHWAERFAHDAGVDLDASWFYTDSFSDLPMLQRVGVRRVVNPDSRLKRHALRAGWPIEEW
jgi:HAD superfamily hydrolase (TIGR01490 family)